MWMLFPPKSTKFGTLYNRCRIYCNCKLHLSCVKNMMRRYSRVNFKGQGQLNLGQPSCYFDPRSNFQLDLPRSTSLCFDASWREKHDGAQINPLSFLVQKLFAKNGTPQNCYLFYFDPTLARFHQVHIFLAYLRQVCCQSMIDVLHGFTT